MIDNYTLIWLKNEVKDRFGGWRSNKLMPRYNGNQYHLVRDNTEPISVENKPFLAELEIVAFGGTNSSFYCYLRDIHTGIVYPTFGGFLQDLKVIRKLRRGRIRGIWIVKKKSAYYGIELLD